MSKCRYYMYSVKPYTSLACLKMIVCEKYKKKTETCYIPILSTIERTWSLGMRRYGDISIQYRYGGSRYASWPSAIYRDTTLTFVIRGSHHVVSIFVYDEFFVFVQEIYIYKNYNLCGRCLCKMPVEMDL